MSLASSNGIPFQGATYTSSNPFSLSNKDADLLAITGESLVISGNASVLGTLTTRGIQGETLELSDSVSAQGSIYTAGNFNAGGDASITGDLILSGALTVGSFNLTNVTIAGTLGVTGATALTTLASGTQTITGNETISGTLGVTGATTLGTLASGNQTITGNETISGTLGVTGATTLTTLASGNQTITGNETISGTLGVTGASTFSSNMTLAPNLSFNQGNWTMGHDAGGATGSFKLRFSGVDKYSFGSAGTFQSGNISATGTLSVTGATTLTGTLNSGNQAVTGNQTTSGTLSVTGATTLTTLSSGNQTITGNQTTSGTLSVTGTSTLGAVTCAGITNSGAMSCTNATVSGTLTTGAYAPSSISTTTLGVSGTSTLGDVVINGTLRGIAAVSYSPIFRDSANQSASFQSSTTGQLIKIGQQVTLTMPTTTIFINNSTSFNSWNNSYSSTQLPLAYRPVSQTTFYTLNAVAGVGYYHGKMEVNADGSMKLFWTWDDQNSPNSGGGATYQFAGTSFTWIAASASNFAGEEVESFEQPRKSLKKRKTSI